MNKISYPLKFEPLLQNNIWGGDYLKTRSKIIPEGPVGESWEISDYKTETTKIINGEHKGKSLHEVIDLLYPKTIDFDRFPLLLKILAPESELSVQVHPNDDYTSNLNLKESGKAEAWYIIEAPENSFLYLGLTERINKEQLKKSVEDHTLNSYLNKVYVKKGDVVNIPHGTIHSLCPKIKVFEIQQSSNITYRLYDWGRVDKNGQGRQLHIKEALDVVNYDYLPPSHLVTPEIIYNNGYLREKYIESTNFTMEKISKMRSPIKLDNSEFKIHIITSINSKLEISTSSGSVTLDKYDSCLIPAMSGIINISGNLESEFLLYC